MSKHISVVLAIGMIIAFAFFVSGCSGPKSPGTPSYFVQSKMPVNETELKNYYMIIPATAKDWYGVAEREAFNHSSDMVLYYVEGMQDDRVPLPANGMSREWIYGFFSPSHGDGYYIHVKAGIIRYADYTGRYNVSSNFSSMSIKDWNLDSDTATAEANEIFRQNKGMEPFGRAECKLATGNATYDHHPIWDIIYDPCYEKGYNPQHYFRVKVDASTGAILSSTDSFNA